MPTLSVSLTQEQDDFIMTRVASGQYESASEVMCAALHSLKDNEQQEAEKLAYLHKALEEGLASGIATGDVVGRVQRRIRAAAKKQQRAS